MTFADLQLADAVSVDANTFIYHFTPEPVLGAPCSQLLQRIENQELTGFTSFHVASEVAHKMITVEANSLWGWPFAGMANRLRRQPAEVRQLQLFRKVLGRLDKSRIQVLNNSLADLLVAAALSQQTGEHVPADLVKPNASIRARRDMSRLAVRRQSKLADIRRHQTPIFHGLQERAGTGPVAAPATLAALQCR